ncbi:MAG TPA: glycosyltransferase family 4 protein [Acidimicrobiia bacterium]
MTAAALAVAPRPEDTEERSSKKILWYSNAPWAPTGYGLQTALFVPKIRDAGYDIAISALWGLNHTITAWDGITVYPGDPVAGFRSLPAQVAHWAGTDDCLLITLWDVWPLRVAGLEKMRVAAWVPVDHDPVPPGVFEFFSKYGARAIAMSKFGQAALRAVGIDAFYVPHGVDTTIYKPSGGRERVRAAMGIPEDAFLIGMIANNKGTSPSRKGYPEAFAAFAEFARSHDNAYLYVHAEKHPPGGLNLPLTADMLGIPRDRIIWAPQFEYIHGLIEPGEMAVLYSSLDVLLNPSWGEGFGIPIVEAQACGTPVIVSNWTSMPELCGAGWLVEGEKFFNAPQGSYWLHPFVGSIVEALEKAYTTPRDEEKAVAFAAQYDADLVMKDHWLPVLEVL